MSVFSTTYITLLNLILCRFYLDLNLIYLGNETIGGGAGLLVECTALQTRDQIPVEPLGSFLETKIYLFSIAVHSDVERV